VKKVEIFFVPIHIDIFQFLLPLYINMKTIFGFGYQLLVYYSAY